MAKSFNNRDGWIWVNGDFLPWREAKCHIITQGLHYASAVFEGERAYKGKIFKSSQHTKRLFNSAKIIGMTIPFSEDEITLAKEELVRRGGEVQESIDTEYRFNATQYVDSKFANLVNDDNLRKIFNYNTKINIDNPKNFYSRFLIPKKNRIDLKPINLSGNIDLESFEIKLDQVYFEDEFDNNEIDKNELLDLKDKINNILSQNSLDNILRYSNLRKIIQSFFN